MASIRLKNALAELKDHNEFIYEYNKKTISLNHCKFIRDILE